MLVVQALAELSLGRAYPDPWFLLLFLVGAFVMRGAGCAYNDIVDRDYRRQGRAHGRPADPLGPGDADGRRWCSPSRCASSGSLVLLQFNWPTVLLGAVLAAAGRGLSVLQALHLLAAGDAGADLQVGRAGRLGGGDGLARAGRRCCSMPAAVLWTIGYDTIYAHQDKEDDLMVGLKSTALRFGERTPTWVAGFYAGALVLWHRGRLLAGGALVLLHRARRRRPCMLAWQVATLDIDDAANCLRRFRANRDVGWVLFVGLVARHGAVGADVSARLTGCEGRSGVGAALGCRADVDALPSTPRAVLRDPGRDNATTGFRSA